MTVFLPRQDLVDTGRMDAAIDILFDGESFIYDGNLRGGNALRAIQTQLGLVYLYTDRIDLAAPIIEVAGG